jgi:RNA polymerase sigma-70 factor, ECF subfamily
VSSAPDVKKGFDHFCLGRARGGGPGAHSFRRLPGAKLGLPRRSFTARYSSQKSFGMEWNKVTRPAVYHIDVSGVDPQSGSFEELAMPLFDPLYNFAHWLTRNRDQAEDLVQETYLKALKGFSSFQLGTNFRAWMYRILRNTFLTSCAGLKATTTLPLDDAEDDEGPELAVEFVTPETILIDRSNADLIEREIDELPVHFREVLLLCEVEEMSYQEIAETLSVPIGTVMSRLSRARKRLRDGLQQGMNEGSRSGETPVKNGMIYGL